jgi:PIN domain nuclease of toxin-antitoxin system
VVEEGRIPSDAFERLKTALADRDFVLQIAPLVIEVVDALWQVPRAEVPDMPDRIVASTALHFGVPLISCDRLIRASRVPTIW